MLNELEKQLLRLLYHKHSSSNNIPSFYEGYQLRSLQSDMKIDDYLELYQVAKNLDKKGSVNAVWGWDNDCEIRLNRTGLLHFKKLAKSVIF